MELTYNKGLVAAFGICPEHRMTEYILRAGFLAAGIDYKYHIVSEEEGLLTPESMDEVVRISRFLQLHGFQLDKPYEKKIIPHLDRLSPVARITGIANVVANHDGEFVGENSHAKGLTTALMMLDVIPQGHTFFVEGKGDLAEIVAVELAISGADKIYLFSEGSEPAFKKTELLSKESDTELIFIKWTEKVNLPEDVDIFVRAGQESVQLEGIRPDLILCNMNLYEKERNLEWFDHDGPVIRGQDIFFHKIRLHFSLWTEHFTAFDVMWKATEEAIERENPMKKQPELHENGSIIYEESGIEDYPYGQEKEKLENLIELLMHQDFWNPSSDFAFITNMRKNSILIGQKEELSEEELLHVEVAATLCILCKKMVVCCNEDTKEYKADEEKIAEKVWNLMEESKFVEDFTDRILFMIFHFREEPIIYEGKYLDVPLKVLKEAAVLSDF